MFTIVICTYNGERTIEKTLNHIYAQRKFDEYIEQVQPQMQASLDEAWESVE